MQVSDIMTPKVFSVEACAAVIDDAASHREESRPCRSTPRRKPF